MNKTIFEWNPQKARLNIRRHGVRFEEATTVFTDPLSLTIDDPLHSNEEEERYIIIGESSQKRVLVVIHTDRGDHIRLISARVANSHEKKEYEESYPTRS
jgi:hypothetical protein